LVFSGGLLGLAASYGACLALFHFTPVKPLVTIDTVLLSLCVSILVGAVFGLIPAVRAAAREPVASLRYE
jgi:putative ABC transport system permease protein